MRAAFHGRSLDHAKWDVLSFLDMCFPRQPCSFYICHFLFPLLTRSFRLRTTSHINTFNYGRHNLTEEIDYNPPTYTQTTCPETFPTPIHGDISWHTLISSPQTESPHLCAGIATCLPVTGHLCAHRNAQAEIFHILDGEGNMNIAGIVSKVRARCREYGSRMLSIGLLILGLWS